MIVLYVLLVLLALFLLNFAFRTAVDAVLLRRERRYYRYRDRRLRAALAMMAESPADATFSFRDHRLMMAVGTVETPSFAWRGPFKELTPFEETMLDLSRTCWVGIAPADSGITNVQFQDPAFRFRLTDSGRRAALAP